MKRLAFVLLAAPLLVPAALQAAAATGTIEGVVRTANGAPVAGVSVTVKGPELTAITDQHGAFVVQDVPAGERFVVTASLAGVVAPPVPLLVLPGRNVVNFTMEPTFTSAVTVSAEIPLLNASDGVSRLTLSPAQIAVAAEPRGTGHLPRAATAAGVSERPRPRPASTCAAGRPTRT